ncbi:MAG TPA: DNA recombination protein RmuC [Caldithrix sp.]|nr:DNA recombination protein RmuC [Calditrichaceae bacterium]HEM49002.1 DNA recombination protein RmuC [Caldithrix sp.]
MFEIIYFVIGFVLGSLILFIIMNRQQKSAKELAEELARQTREDKLQEMDRIINQLKESFGSISMESLSKSTSEFLKLAGKSFSDQSKMGEQQLDSKKQLIDETLKNMKSELEKVQEVVKKVENERKESFGQLTSQIRQSVEQTKQLQDVTNQLNTALSSSQIRGQWGERMAEDVLRLAGFIEGINYLKQKSISGSSSRPDFTFLLPKNLKVNMDVKFPLNNYMAFLQADSESDKSGFKNQFLKDVRTRVKEVTTRDYINPTDNTVDYVIVFIPNEQVYSFINENDPSIMDDALRSKVILSSPVTLYAILAIIRQAIDNFNLEKTAAEILSLLGEFNKQWNNFKEGMDKMGNRLDDAQKEFQKLVTTRTTQLERPLLKIDAIRSDNRLQPPDEDN